MPADGKRKTYKKEIEQKFFFQLNTVFLEEPCVSRAPGLGKINKHSSYFYFTYLFFFVVDKS